MPRNGATFYTLLDAALMRAHDAGLLNENALHEVVEELLAGQPLTRGDLARIFGVDALFRLLPPAMPSTADTPRDPEQWPCSLSYHDHKTREEAIDCARRRSGPATTDRQPSTEGVLP